MASTRIYKAPIFYLGIAAGLIIAGLLWASLPQGDPQAAGGRSVRNFDKNVKLAASSGITLRFTRKTTGTGCTQATQKCGKFSGTVTSPDSRCLGGRTVTITGPNGFSTTTTTNPDGSYTTAEFKNLTSGQYTATVAASSGYGYTCAAATSNTVTV